MMSGLHDHAEEIEKSRSPRNSARRSNSNLGPLKTPGRGTPPGAETTRPLSAPSVGEELPDDIPKVSIITAIVRSNNFSNFPVHTGS